MGQFLREHLQALNLKNKTFARYLDIEGSNLSAILNGKRKITVELAFKLGQVFNLSPDLWLLIQSKNEILQLSDTKIMEYKKYKLADLMKRAG